MKFTKSDRNVRRALFGGLIAISLISYAFGQSSSQMSDSASSATENALIDNYIRSYPNPTDGLVKIDLGKSYKGVTVEIRSVSGKLISQEKFAEASLIDTTIEGPAGIYFLKITGNDMRQIIHRISKR